MECLNIILWRFRHRQAQRPNRAKPRCFLLFGAVQGKMDCRLEETARLRWRRGGGERAGEDNRIAEPSEIDWSAATAPLGMRVKLTANSRFAARIGAPALDPANARGKWGKSALILSLSIGHGRAARAPLEDSPAKASAPIP